jgi:hypothetical protein
LIRLIRRECLDHVIVCGERHLRHVLRAYAHYYNGAEHTCRWLRTRPARAVQALGSIFSLPILGGLHHHYVRI